MRMPVLDFLIETFESRQDPAHADDRVASVFRPASMCGDTFGRDLDPLEALVSDGDLHVCRLTDDSGIGLPLRHEGLGTDAAILFVDNGRDHNASGLQSAT